LAQAALHPHRRASLVAERGSAEAVVAAIEAGVVKVPPAAREAVGRSAAWASDRLDALGVRAVFRGDPGFPVFLDEGPDAPDVLFVRGSLPDRPGVAVVGTRTCTGYGRRLARAYGRAVAVAGWSVISGLARGIDGEAHLGTVSAGGTGVAVLGCGPDVVYPPEHGDLMERLVAAGGAVVTEYPPGTRPDGWRFPPRNRVIAGLAGVVVVVESAVTGGALTTAAAALTLGRRVFAVPGDVGRPSSVGCNLLIRDGAVPVLDPDDLVESVALELGPPPSGTHYETSAEQLIPTSGATVESLAALLRIPIPEMLAVVSRLEAAGRVRREQGLVVPEF
jgi:DNA processing protein